MAWFPTLLGNDTLKAALEEHIEKRSLSHAYIIEGPNGSGKRTLARLIAAALACEGSGKDKPCMHCSSCEKILSGQAVDVHLYERGKEATVKIEVARKIREEMILSATENEHRIFIVDDADMMTVAAQNALLIALEEPPENVFIFLLVTDASRLLPTVRSRAQRLTMSRFDFCTLREHVLTLSADARALAASSPDTFAAVLMHANGTVGEAISLLSPSNTRDILEKRATVDAIVLALAEHKPFGDIYSLSQALPRKRDELSAMLALLLKAITDLILLKRDPDAPLSYYCNRETAADTAAHMGIATLFAVLDAIDAALADLDRNANLTTVVTSLFSQMKL